MTGSGSIRILQPAAPEVTGLSSQRLERMAAALQREVSEGRIPGAVAMVARQGHLVYAAAAGARDKAAGAPMALDSIFSIASMTKPMVSVAILCLLEEGRLLLADPVEKYLPAFSGLKVQHGDGAGGFTVQPVKRPPTIQDLLRHTSGLSYRDRGTTPAHKLYPGHSIMAAERLTGEEFIAALAQIPLIYEPGTTWEYGFSTDVLGLVAEAIEGERLSKVLARRIWQPLAMKDTAFALSDAQRGRYAKALPVCPLTGQSHAIHHADPAKTQKYESGGGGLVSTAGDYLRFTQMLLNGGVLGEARILGRKSVDLMRSDHLADGIGGRIADTMDPASAGYGFGLGFAVRRQAGIAAMHGSTGDYYWSGVYGTYFWIDPVEDLCVVFMAAAPGLMRLRYRQLMRSLVLQAIVD